MDEQLPKKIFPFGQRGLLGLLLIFLFLLLVFGFNFFGLYNLSEKVGFLRFLPTQEDSLVREVDALMSIVQNPDPQLIAKYNIPKEQLQDEQILILCGGYPTSDRKLVLDEAKCLPDSLVGIRKAIKTKDLSQALILIKKVYQTVSNASFNDSAQIAGRKTAQQIDPENLFHGLVMIRPGETIPDDQPLPPGAPSNLGGVHGSEVKKDAVIKMIKLFYVLKKR